MTCQVSMQYPPPASTVVPSLEPLPLQQRQSSGSHHSSECPEQQQPNTNNAAYAMPPPYYAYPPHMHPAYFAAAAGPGPMSPYAHAHHCPHGHPVLPYYSMPQSPHTGTHVASAAMMMPAGRSSTAAAARPQQEAILPTDKDVLMGRGGKNNQHAGNDTLRDMAWAEKDRYKTASKKEKSTISRELVAKIRALPGRFLKRDTVTNQWEDVGDDMAREKTSQVLRDAVAGNYKYFERTTILDDDDSGSEDGKEPGSGTDQNSNNATTNEHDLLARGVSGLKVAVELEDDPLDPLESSNASSNPNEADGIVTADPDDLVAPVVEIIEEGAATPARNNYTSNNNNSNNNNKAKAPVARIPHRARIGSRELSPTRAARGKSREYSPTPLNHGMNGNTRNKPVQGFFDRYSALGPSDHSLSMNSGHSNAMMMPPAMMGNLDNNSNQSDAYGRSRCFSDMSTSENTGGGGRARCDTTDSAMSIGTFPAGGGNSNHSLMSFRDISMHSKFSLSLSGHMSGHSITMMDSNHTFAMGGSTHHTMLGGAYRSDDDEGDDDGFYDDVGHEAVGASGSGEVEATSSGDVEEQAADEFYVDDCDQFTSDFQ